MSVKTTTSINIKTGLLFETKGEVEMDMTVKMDVPAANAPKMRITSKAVSTMTVEKVE